MAQDQYIFADGQSLRVLGHKILVRGHELPDKTAGGIWMPGAAVEHIWRTGEILAIGYRELKSGRRIPIPDLEVGLQCVFVRYLAEQDSNKQLRWRFEEDDVFLIGPTDILFVWPEGEEPPSISL